MSKKTAPLLPGTAELLSEFGNRLRSARLRRRLTAKQVAERAGMAPMTLRSLERGGAGVTIGAYLAVMQVLGVEKDLNLLAKADPLGRKLQDARLSAPAKTRVRAGPPASTAPTPRKRSAPIGGAVEQLQRLIEHAPREQLRKAFESLSNEQVRKAVAALPSGRLRAVADRPGASAANNKSRPESAGSGRDWIKKGGFTDSETLAGLIDSAVPRPKRKR